MRNTLVLFIATTLLVILPKGVANTFKDFSVKTVNKALLKTVDYSLVPDATMFKTRLETNIGNTSNFAGSYLIVSIGCGTMCQLNFVLDVKSGKVLTSISSSLGLCYSATSRLLIVNPFLSEHYPEDIPDWANTEYYHIKNNQLILLDKSKVSYHGECAAGQ